MEGDSEGGGKDLVISGASGLGLEAGEVNPAGFCGAEAFFIGDGVNSGVISLGTSSVEQPAKALPSSPAWCALGSNGVAAARVPSSSTTVVDLALPLATETFSISGGSAASSSKTVADPCRSGADGGGSAYVGAGGSPPAGFGARSRSLNSGSGLLGPDPGGSGPLGGGSGAAIPRSGGSSVAQVMNGGNGGSALEALTSTAASAVLVQNVAVLAQAGIPLTSWESLDVCDGDTVNVAPGIAPRVMDGSMPGGALVSGAMHCGGGVPRVFGGSPPPTVAGTSLGTVGANDLMGVRCSFTGGVSGAIFPTPQFVDSGVALAADMEDEPGLDDVELDALEEAFDPLAGGVDSARMGSSVSRSVGGNIDCNAISGFGALPDAIAARGVGGDSNSWADVECATAGRSPAAFQASSRGGGGGV
ncbi:hypothetical protein KSP40_PGU005401 [Platanthera guangdongensis]|uniref:Uncharacterized protein n=1 Tax=Platanthera guangdongensis TaxID=2320717 RepID=A0ABR2M1L4_9ASPA